VDTTLTDAQMLGTLSMKFTGTLTAGRTITIPAKTKLLMVENATTGGFTISVKTPSGTPISMGVGERKLLYCDGTTFQIVAETAVGASIPYDIGGTLAGIPTGGAVVLRYPIPRAVRFPAAWPTAVAWRNGFWRDGDVFNSQERYAIRHDAICGGCQYADIYGGHAHGFCSRRRADHHRAQPSRQHACRYRLRAGRHSTLRRKHMALRFIDGFDHYSIPSPDPA
jgi:hypothetical protein